MIREKVYLLMMFVVLFFCFLDVNANEPDIPDCNMSRIIVPLAHYNGKVTCAASFVYGQYVNEPEDRSDILTATKLSEKLNELQSSSRWTYPEYVAIKYYQEWRKGNKQEYLKCLKSGESLNMAERHYKPISQRKNRSLLETLNEMLFLDKGKFGSLTRIGLALYESKDNAKGRGVPLELYLVNIDGEYKVTKEIDYGNIFSHLVKSHEGKVIVHRQEPVFLRSNNIGIENWFAIDVDANGEMVYAYSSQAQDVPSHFSGNYLKIYLDFEPVNIRLEAGKKATGLTEELRFLESAITATYVNPTEERFLEYWRQKEKSRLKSYIKRLKKINKWPEYFAMNLGESIQVLAKFPTSEGSIIYYKDNSNRVEAIGIKSDDMGNYSLYQIPGGIYRDEFSKAIGVLTGN